MRQLFYQEGAGDKIGLSFELSNAFLRMNDLDSAEKYGQFSLWTELPVTQAVQARAMTILGYIQGAKLAFKLADSLFVEATKLATTDSQLIFITLLRADLYHRSDQYGKVLDVLKPIEGIILEKGNAYQKTDYYNTRFHYYFSEGDVLNQLLSLLEAKKYALEGRQESLRVININLGNIYLRIKAYEEAYDLYHENLENSIKNNETHNTLYAYFGVANALVQLEKYEQVKKYCFDAIKLRNETGYSRAFGFIYAMLGVAYLEEENLDSAKYYNEIGLEISRQQKEEKELGDNLILKGRIKLAEGDTSGARPFFIDGEKKRGYVSRDIRHNLARILMHEQRYREAFSILEENVSREALDKEDGSIYETAKVLLRDRNKKERMRQKSLQEQQLQRQKLNLSLAGILIIVLLASVIIMVQNRSSKKLEEVNRKLLKKNEELYHFTYICSHDLKEPIRNVSAFSGMVQEKLKGKELKSNYDEYFDYVFRGVSTLSTIVNSLKVFSEIEGNDQGWLEKVPVPVEEIFRQAYSNLEVFIREHEAEVSFTNHTHLKKVKTSFHGMTLVVQNLIHNAIKYNESGAPVVCVSLHLENECPVIKVSDNGIGIDEKYFEYIFKPFKTLDNKSRTNSSGLGLSICKKIVTELGGKILVEAREEGGSTFVIVLDKLLKRDIDLKI